MSIEQYPTLPDSQAIYSPDDLSKEDLRVLYLASLTEDERAGAELSDDDVFDWLDNFGGVGRALINHVRQQAGGRPIKGQATPTSETYYEHLGLDVDAERNVSA